MQIDTVQCNMKISLIFNAKDRNLNKKKMLKQQFQHQIPIKSFIA